MQRTVHDRLQCTAAAARTASASASGTASTGLPAPEPTVVAAELERLVSELEQGPKDVSELYNDYAQPLKVSEGRCFVSHLCGPALRDASVQDPLVVHPKHGSPLSPPACRRGLLYGIPANAPPLPPSDVGCLPSAGGLCRWQCGARPSAATVGPLAAAGVGVVKV